MKTKARFAAWGFGLGIALGASSAVAQSTQPQPMGEPATGSRAGEWLHKYSAAVQVGGGVNDFTKDVAEDFLSVGGQWTVRAVLGGERIVGAEFAYVGLAHDVQALGLNRKAGLVGNGVEGALRLGLPVSFGHSDAWTIAPFGFIGIGWQWLTIVNETVNTSVINDDDMLLTLPMGLGLQGRYENLVADARLVYRPTFGDDLIDEGGNLNMIGFLAAVGYQF